MQSELPRTTARSLKVEDLIEAIASGSVRIPEFQRKLRWNRSDNVKLIESTLRGYPIGALLFWQREAPAGRVHFGAIEVDAPASHSAWFIVDGQQRIAALLEALGPRNILTAPRDYWVDLETENVSTSRTDTSIPTYALGDSEQLLGWLDSWPLRSSRPDLAKRAYVVSKRLREYQLPAYVVENASEQVVADVFDRLNSAGKPLKRVDIFRAIERSTGSEPGRLEALQVQVGRLAFGTLKDGILLQSVQALSGQDITKAPPRGWPKEAQARAFADVARALSATIVFLKSRVGIPHSALLPYSLPLAVLTKVFHMYPELSHRNLTLLARWFWRGTLTGALRGDNVPLVGRFVAAVHPKSADRAVHDLLGTVESKPPLPHLAERLSLRGALAKVEVLALLQYRPVDLGSLVELDASRLLDEFALSRLLQHLVPRATPSPWAHSIANRIFHPPIGRQVELFHTERDALQSHALIPEDVADDPAQMLESRAQRLESHMHGWLTEAGGFNQTDRVPLSMLLAGTDTQ